MGGLKAAPTNRHSGPRTVTVGSGFSLDRPPPNSSFAGIGDGAGKVDFFAADIELAIEFDDGADVFG